MKLQQQQTFYDCFLATIAMLANTSLSEVTQKVCKLGDIDSFHEIAYDYIKFWPLCANTAEFYNLPNLAKTCRMLVNYPSMQMLKDCSKVQPFKLDVDLSGKGQIGIYWKDSGHSIAFENNIIFDPNADKPMTFTEWQEWSKTAYASQGGIPERMIVTKESD